ncbi:MAG TPA: hypothetical protein VLJ68_11950 [Chitinophagaceae bacterium]|nr:hypothetical protein [Chitinophagaceae bacterium]
MGNNKIKAFLPVLVLFLILNAFFLAGNHFFKKWDVDKDVLIIGNLVLFISSFFSYLISLRGLRTSNPHAFVRSVYGSFIIKFFFCIVAALIYIMTMKKDVNKPALFTCMALYLVYSFVEVGVLTKMLKQKKNA